MRTVKLPGGERIWGMSRFETAILHHQIFVLRSYDRCGIELRDGCTVFDIGANIGMYGVYLAPRLKSPRIFAFEPIPQLAAILRRNVADHMPGADVRVFEFGLSDRDQELPFIVDPSMSFTSTSRPEVVLGAVDPDRGRAEWARAGVHDLAVAELVSPAIGRLLERALNWRPMGELAGQLFALGVALGAKRTARIPPLWCRCRPLSDVIAEQGVERIDLLKVDAEGAELDVLNGLQEADWPKVRQAVVEVHDVDGQLDRMSAMFREHGFKTSNEWEDYETLRLMGISTLYATRD